AVLWLVACVTPASALMRSCIGVAANACAPAPAARRLVAVCAAFADRFSSATTADPARALTSSMAALAGRALVSMVSKAARPSRPMAASSSLSTRPSTTARRTETRFSAIVPFQQLVKFLDPDHLDLREDFGHSE